VLKFNGEKIKNLQHLAEKVDACEEEFMKFDLEYCELVVLNSEEAIAATADVLDTHAIPASQSKDIKRSGRAAVESTGPAVVDVEVSEDEA